MRVSDPVKPRLIFINRYSHPDHSATSQMLSDLTFALTGLGYRISIITSRQLYDAPAVRLAGPETISSVVSIACPRRASVDTLFRGAS